MSWQDCMKRCLPRGAPVITSRYGVIRHLAVYGGKAKGHFGVDFAYPGGRPKNHGHEVRAPIDGQVTGVGGSCGLVKIKDSKGYSHEILHMIQQFVKVGDHVTAGQKIGLMGGVLNGRDMLAPHVHYQLRLPGCRTTTNPIDFWDNNKAQYMTPDPDGEEEEIPHSDDAYYGNWTGEPTAPSGNVNDYMPRQAGISSQSGAELALWTNRVPQHEPWGRTLMVNTPNLNAKTDEWEYNTRHNPQFTDETEAGSKGVGRIEGEEDIPRGPFWRR